MAPPTLVTRNDPHAKMNLVTVTLDGDLIRKGLVSADSDAGVIVQEMSEEEANVLEIPTAARRAILLRDRMHVVRTGTVVITVKTLVNQNFTPSTDGNNPWPEKGRPYKSEPSPDLRMNSSPWAPY